MPKSMTVIYNKKTQVISHSDPRYSEIIASLASKKKVDEQAIKDILQGKIKESHPRITISPKTKAIKIDNKKMPPGLEKQYLLLKQAHRPRGHLVKFWDLLQKNPSKHSQEQLFKFLEHNGHYILPNGHFTAYKAVTQDFLDDRTKQISNRPGDVVSMPREKVDPNPSNTCSTGLHVASWAYIQTEYQGRRYVEVSINPEHVVAVPDDYNGTKMRVCEYQVLREVSGETQPEIFQVNEKVIKSVKDLHAKQKKKKKK